MEPRPRITDVVVPAHNAAAILPEVLAQLPHKRVRSVTVVDTDSHDATSQLGRDAGAVVLRSKAGYGAGCLLAIEHLSRLPEPPEVVAFVPGDGSSDPADLPKLLASIDGGAELVLGVRERGRPVSEKVVLGLIEAVYRHRFHDLAPMRAIRFPALVALGMSDQGSGWDVEMQVRALKLGLGIAEVVVGRGPKRRRGAPHPARAAIAQGRSLFHILRHATVR